ncbi:MAG: oligoribonuclease [Gammaproteobacteria bacterium]|nr:oligoribonuclease [Gammaproteobacteria bacterium]
MRSGNLVWIDLEMTGLDPFTDRIIEIAAVVTNKDLEELAVGPALAIHQEPSVLQAMDDWNTKQHAKSGLTERVRNSEVSEEQAEQAVLNFIRQHVPSNESPMCGNSICQDRRFLARFMPELERYFHYRNLDVSTLKELAQRWYPKEKGFEKESKHLALDDIRGSIEELRYYRSHLLKSTV